MSRATKLALVLSTLALLVAARDARAQTASSTMAVSATVSKVCTVSAGALAFGPYDPNGSQVTQSATITLQCTRGVAYTVSLDAGKNSSGGTRRMTDGVAFLNYDIYTASDHQTVWNNTNTKSGTAAGKDPFTLTAYGLIPAGQDVPFSATPDSYKDTVTVTVAF